MGKDALRWCAVTGDEERRRGKSGSGVRCMGVDFVFYASGTCGSEWSKTSDLSDA
jgi:hypothetical protein